MIPAPIIMAAVAMALLLTGAALLLALLKPRSPAQRYLFRMTGIMAIAAGAILAFYAHALWRGQALP